MSCHAHGLAASRGMLTREDVDLIGNIVEPMTDSETILVVDLGSGSGTTALSVFAVRERDVKIIGIESKESELYWATEAVKNIGRSKDWAAILGDVLDPINIPSSKINFLMIDIVGNFDKILELWLPHMAPSGAVWIHNHKEPSVEAAIDKVITDGKFLVGAVINKSSLVGSAINESSAIPPKKKQEDVKDELVSTTEREGTFHSSSQKTVGEDRPPCKVCGHITNPEKNYKNAMSAHMRKHAKDKS